MSNRGLGDSWAFGKPYRPFVTPRKRRWSVVAAATAFFVIALSAVAVADVSTDPVEYYAPGETVNITGDGMSGGETVAVDIAFPDGSLAQHHEVQADESGQFGDTYVADSVLGVYTVTATGETSGNAYTTLFAVDDATSDITFTISGPSSATSVAPGATLTWSAPATCTGPADGPQSCSAGGTSVGGAVPSTYTIDIQQTGGSCDFTSPTVRVSATGATANGTFAAPSTPGVYCYRARHQQQSISGVTWATANSNQVLIFVFNLESYASAGCETSTTTVNSFTSGTEVCAKAFALPNSFAGRIDWVDPSANVDDSDTFASLTDNRAVARFTPTDCGTWTAKLYDNAAPPNLLDTDNFEVTGCNTAPSVAFNNPPTSANEGETKTFNFDITDTAGDTFTFVSSFPDCGSEGTLVMGSASISGASGSFQCLFPDGDVPAVSSTVRVQVKDQGNLTSNIATVGVTVNNVAPQVSYTGSPPSTADEGDTKTYNFSVDDPGDDTYGVSSAFYPTCGTGGSLVSGSLAPASLGSGTASGTVAGSFQCLFPDGPADTDVSIQFTDSDNEAGNTETQMVHVNNVNPTVVAGFAVTEVNCQVSLALTIDPDDKGVNDSPWKINIAWGDGNTEPEITRTNLDSFSVSHTYALPGPYNATVSVKDKDNGTGSDNTNPITVLQTYTVDFLPPFDDSTPSGLIVNKMKNGRVVPVKATIFDDCTMAYVTDPTTNVTIKVTKTSGTGTGDPIEEYADAGQSSTGTNAFRWTTDPSVTGGGFWIYNLDSKALGLIVNNLYRVDAYVGSVKATVSNWAVLMPVK